MSQSNAVGPTIPHPPPRLDHPIAQGVVSYARDGGSQRRPWEVVTNRIGGLLGFVALLVGFGLVLIRLTLLGVQCLPSLSEHLANLA